MTALLALGLLCTVSVQCSSAGAVLPDLPSATELFDKAADYFSGPYKVSATCNAVLSSSGTCTVIVAADPSMCMTPDLIVSKLFDSGTAANLAKALPGQVALSGVEVGVCARELKLSLTSTETLELVPNAISLTNANLEVTIAAADKAIDITFSGEWQVGSVTFSLAASRSADGSVSLDGTTVPEDQEFNMAQLLTSVGGKLGSSSAINSAATQLNLNSLAVQGVSVKAIFISDGQAYRFSFTAVSSALGDPTLYLTLNKVKSGTSSKNIITIAATFSNLKIGDTIKSLTGLDVTNVPFIGTTQFSDMQLVLSNEELDSPLLEYENEEINDMAPFKKGLKMRTKVQFSTTGSPTPISIIVSGKKFQFEILGDAGISAKDFLNKLISTIEQVKLPPGFNLDSFLNIELSGFEYDSDSKHFTLQIVLPNTIVIIPKAIELQDATVIFEVQKGAGSPGVQLISNWDIGSITIPLSIGKPLGSNVFVAESNPQVEIPFGKMIEQFLVKLLPSGGLENAVKSAGFDSFYIRDPHIQIYFAQDKVVKVSGTATIGSWDKCTVEIIMGQSGGSFVMVTGIVVTAVPITGLIKTMTGGNINLGALPGAKILDNTDAAVVMSSQAVPKSAKYAQFSNEALENIQIVDGVSVVSSFKFPDECGNDKACKTAKRLLGSSAQLVLKGRLYLASIELSATVPTQIQINKGFNLTDVGFEIQAGATRNSIAIKGTLEIPVPNQSENLALTGAFGISTSGAYLQMAMEGMWKNPFGVPFFAIGNLNLLLAVGPDPLAVTALELGGMGKLGDFDNPKAKPVEAQMYCGIDRYTVTENYFQGKFSALTIPDLLAAFAQFPKLPDALKEIGFPDGVSTSFSLRSRTLKSGVSIPRGYYLAGTIQVLFFKATADIKLELNGIFVNLTVAPFNIGNGAVVVSGRSKTQGPRVLVDVGWNPPRAFINIEGHVKVLGISQSTNITVDENGMSLSVKGKFLNFFQAGLTITANYKSMKTADFQVDGYFEQDLFDKLEEGVHNGLMNYKEEATKAIKKAEDKVEAARKDVKDAGDAVAAKQAAVSKAQKWFDSAKAEVDRASRKVEEQKKVFDQAGDAVNRARDKVKDAENKLSAAQRALDGKKNCPSACRKRRDVGKETFLEARKAKAFVARSSRVKRGWGPGETIEEGKEKIEDAKEATARAAKEKARELSERAREVKCAGERAARETCLLAFKAAQKTLDAAKGVLKGAQGALIAAEKVAREAKVSLDVAKVALTAAEYTLEGAKRSLDAAKAALVAAQKTVQLAGESFRAAELALVGVRHANAFGTMIADKVSQFGLKGIFSIYHIKFSVKVSVASSGHFNGEMRARFLTKTDTFAFSIKLRSLKDMVEFLIKKVKEEMGF